MSIDRRFGDPVPPSTDEPMPLSTTLAIVHHPCHEIEYLLALPREFANEADRSTPEALRERFLAALDAFCAHPDSLKSPHQVHEERPREAVNMLPLEEKQGLHRIRDLLRAWNPTEPLPRAAVEEAREILLLADGFMAPLCGWEEATFASWNGDPRDADLFDARKSMVTLFDAAARLAAPRYFERWELSPAERRTTLLEMIAGHLAAFARLEHIPFKRGEMVGFRAALPLARALHDAVATWPAEGAPPATDPSWAPIRRDARAWIKACWWPLDYETFEGWERPAAG